jgi:hypothetical protein
LQRKHRRCWIVKKIIARKNENKASPRELTPVSPALTPAEELRMLADKVAAGTASAV